MTVIFICGSLELGKDGVGDYTRRLSAYCIKNNVSTGILALNDKFITEVTEEIQLSDNQRINCYRIPNIFKTRKATKLAKTWIKTKSPKWLSLQFVPYAFHPKGLPFGLAKQLKKIGCSVRWHVMFHELWIGMSYESSKKEWLIGGIQKMLITNLVKKLQPLKITTQTRLYSKYITDLDCNVSLLPLFSNIPKVQYDNKYDFNIKLPERFAVVFGGIHTGAPVASFAKELKSLDKDISIVFIGRNGSVLNQWIQNIKIAGIETLVLGTQGENVISWVFSKAIFGISSTPMALVEKSGSLAAMHLHNLPVICIAKAWKPRGIIVDWKIDGIEVYEEHKLYEILNTQMSKSISTVALNDLCNMFLDHLKINTYG